MASLLSRREAAAVLRISTATLDRLTKAGVIPALKIGSRTVRYRSEALSQALRPTGPGQTLNGVERDDRE